MLSSNQSRLSADWGCLHRSARTLPPGVLMFWCGFHLTVHFLLRMWCGLFFHRVCEPSSHACVCFSQPFSFLTRSLKTILYIHIQRQRTQAESNSFRLYHLLNRCKSKEEKLAHPLSQCAAVNTQYLFIKEPPQKCWRSVVCMDTMYLIECGTGAYPPTIRSCAASWPETEEITDVLRLCQ